jgi:hypothetical protein
MTRCRKLCAFVLCAFVCPVCSIYAEPVFYLSADPIGVATPPDPADTLLVQRNAPSSLNIFVMTDVRMSRISLDVMNMGGAIEFNSLNVLNENHRWLILNEPQIVEPDEIRNIGGGALPGISGNGIGPGSPDPGLDPTSGYLIATLGYTATNNLGATSELFMKIGVNIMSDWDGNSPAVRLGGPNHDLTPGDVWLATDSLLDYRIRVVPEPGSIVLAALASISAAALVRRRLASSRSTPVIG